MKDYLTQLEKLRKDAADCALIRDLATEKISMSCSIGLPVISSRGSG
jgi:hypothetical protein